ncbi:MAG: hypothetical protein KU37_05995 [Sulfuricurvum sp. PC08-66]|nr:MAG: hypothetical protein KU37_05995 [Sulfuricurvum sp. PC08-66]
MQSSAVRPLLNKFFLLFALFLSFLMADAQKSLEDALMARDYDAVTAQLKAGAPYAKEGALQPFMLAISYAPLRVIEAFLEAGANVNTIDDYLGTPLLLALQLERIEVAKALLKANATVDAPSFKRAIALKNAPLLQEMLERYRVDDESFAILGEAIGQWQTALVLKMVERGFALHKPYMPSVLEQAIQSGNEEMMHGVLARMGDLKGELGALKRAIERHYTPIATLLLEKGVDVRAQGRDEALLTWAMTYKAYDIATLLLNYAVGIDTLDREGRTPLFGAIEAHQNLLVKRLIDKGANLNILDRYNHSLLYACVAANNYEAFLLLKERVISDTLVILENRPIYLAIKRGFSHFFYALLDETRVTDASLNTLVHLAAYYNRKDMLLYLLLKGHDVEVRNARGETPLIVAVKEGSIQTATMLALWGASLEVKDERGISVLGWAKKNNHAAIVKWIEHFQIKRTYEQ